MVQYCFAISIIPCLMVYKYYIASVLFLLGDDQKVSARSDFSLNTM